VNSPAQEIIALEVLDEALGVLAPEVRLDGVAERILAARALVGTTDPLK
jgi:hypothetical protein